MEEKKIRKMLHDGFVSIIYVKKDGSTRNAVGTLNLQLIPRKQWPQSPPKRSGWVKDGYVRYYDYTVQDWRCLVCDEIIEAKPIDGLSPDPHPEQSSPSRSLPPKGEGGCEMESDEPSNYDGNDPNDIRFEEALRKLEDDLTALENG